MRLQDVLDARRERVQPDPLATYKEVTVRLWGKGVVERGLVPGTEIGSTSRFRVHQRDFVLSKIDARNGALGIVPDSLDGALVSSDFPTYQVKQGKMLPEYLGWLCKTADFVEACRRASEGTTNRVRLKINRFLSSEVPLPSLDEQQRIVAYLDTLSAKIAQARTLRQELNTQANGLLRSAFNRLVEGAPFRPMAELAPLVRRQVEVDATVSYPELGVRSFGKGTFHKPPLTGLELGSKRIYWIEPGDLVFSNVFAWEGAIAVATPHDDNRVGSHRFITRRVNPDLATAPFLCFYFLTPEGLEKIREASPGGAGRNRTLGLQALDDITAPAVPISAQKQFNELLARVGQATDAHLRVDGDLDALLPSALDRAFKGEL